MQKSLKKAKKGPKKEEANRGNNVKLAKGRRKADAQKVDAAITKMINKKNEENLRGRAAADMRAGKAAR